MRLDLDGPAGRLEALYEAPPEPRFCAAVLHPHPLFGGTMDNHATYRLAKAVRGAGGASLRINFRGVGLSAGSYDGGRGEREDARAALTWLVARHPALPLLACGFSFGSWMALEAGCPDAAVMGVLCAGLVLTRLSPFRMLANAVRGESDGDFRSRSASRRETSTGGSEAEEPLPPGPPPGLRGASVSLREVATGAARACPKPVAVVQAERDEFGSPTDVEAALAGAAGPRRVSVVPGAPHLFTGALPALEAEASAALGWILRGGAP